VNIVRDRGGTHAWTVPLFALPLMILFGLIATWWVSR